MAQTVLQKLSFFHDERTGDAGHWHSPKPMFHFRCGEGSFWIVRYMRDLNTGVIGNNSGSGGDSWCLHFYLHPFLCGCTRMVPNPLQNKIHPCNITEHTSASFSTRMHSDSGVRMGQQESLARRTLGFLSCQIITGRQVCVGGQRVKAMECIIAGDLHSQQRWAVTALLQTEGCLYSSNSNSLWFKLKRLPRSEGSMLVERVSLTIGSHLVWFQWNLG